MSDYSYYAPKKRDLSATEIRTHSYSDEFGRVLYDHVKWSDGTWSWVVFASKDEAQETGEYKRPRFSDDDRRIPYGFNARTTWDTAKNLLVAEGEKDVDTAIDVLDQQATCSYAGNGHWGDGEDWKVDGFTTIVIRDHDGAGFDGGLKRAQKLAQAGAKSVRILDLPNLNWKGDLSDWAAGKTKADFESLIEEKAWTYFDTSLPEGEQYPPLPIWGLDDFNPENHRSICIFESFDAAIQARQHGALPPSFQSFFERVLPVVYNGKEPSACDFKAIKKLKLKPEIPVYVWTANSDEGRKLLPKIAKEIHHRTYAIMPDDARFGDGWHLTMEKQLPPKLFRINGDTHYYVGPSPEQMAQPATWLTSIKLVEDGKNEVGGPKFKEVCFLREHAASEWKYIIQDHRFIHDDLPDVALEPDLFDATFSAYCDKSVSKMLAKNNTDRLQREGYRPGVKERRIDFQGQLRWNTWDGTPDEVARRPPADSVQPFLEFMKYLVPDDTERLHLIRWAATLVGKPDRKMLMGVLLKSHAQGVGKGIFTNLILAPMLGWKNVSYPTEQVILEKYGSWWHKKSLAIVSEIHAGNSWKAYEILKSYVTEPVMDFRRMYSDPFSAENWNHQVITANGDLPLLMSDQDRRWLVVSATETPWKEVQFAEFIRWLQAGGVAAVRQWFLKFEQHTFEEKGKVQQFSYFSAGARAPMTETKQTIISDSKSEPVKMAEKIISRLIWENPDEEAEKRKAKAGEIVIWDKVVVEVIKAHFKNAGGKCYLTGAEVRAAAKAAGAVVWDNRIRRKGEWMYAILNDEAWKEASSSGGSSIKEASEASVSIPSDETDENLGAKIREAISHPLYPDENSVPF
ncbi:DUF5906 domain-containing protein [Rhizobium panacihumi]|uniref:primase-helicase family protein n=1 Tax=Rhizobium panacihumi TaxID=2008450 RepID=UPI003D78D5F1